LFAGAVSLAVEVIVNPPEMKPRAEG
jgi:hypothetical protein